MPDKMVFNHPNDLRQLIGWQIQDVVVMPGQAPTLHLIVSNIEAPNKMRVIITPTITAGMTGNITVHTAGFHVSSEPVVEVKKDESGTE